MSIDPQAQLAEAKEPTLEEVKAALTTIAKAWLVPCTSPRVDGPSEVLVYIYAK